MVLNHLMNEHSSLVVQLYVCNFYKEFKLSQYVKNTTIILHGTGDSQLVPLNTIQIYSSVSRLSVNSDKTKLIWKKTML